MSPIVGSVGRHIQFEGSQARLERHDETSDEIKMHEVRASATVPRRPLREFDERALFEHLRDVAEQLARGTSQMMFSTLDEVTEKTGNVVDGHGGPLTEDLLLETFEKMDLDFDERGNWRAPTIFAGSGISKEASVIEKTFASKRFKDMLERKRDEHRRREAARILVG